MESLSIKETLYVCEVQGSDIDGIGSEKMPYKTVQKAINHLKGSLGDSQILVRKAILDSYTFVAKAALKKAVKAFGEQQRKAAKDAELNHVNHSVKLSGASGGFRTHASFEIRA
ncbi:hypothetical protein BC833DRAFT_626334 [Globomyces pollinis-pini]|nr:hypothetical protein BC833DRAFT_626334 [Globomyces pollinis-pini]